jgi:hypothetical protein
LRWRQRETWHRDGRFEREDLVRISSGTCTVSVYFVLARMGEKLLTYSQRCVQDITQALILQVLERSLWYKHLSFPNIEPYPQRGEQQTSHQQPGPRVTPWPSSLGRFKGWATFGGHQSQGINGNASHVTGRQRCCERDSEENMRNLTDTQDTSSEVYQYTIAKADSNTC